MSVLSRIQDSAAEVILPDEVDESYLQVTEDLLKSKLSTKLGLQHLASCANAKDSAQAREELTVALRAILNTHDFSELLDVEREKLIQRILNSVLGLGPIQPLLEDEKVSEVMINGPKQLFYERDGIIQKSNIVFNSQEQIHMVIDRILAPLGRRLDRANPIVNARLANGDRVNAVAEPIAINGPVVTIRKFSNRISSLKTLEELGALPSWYANLLRWAVLARQDIAVAGGTGSGKTTLLNALSCEIPQTERIITIEDSAELRFDKHPDVVSLEARDASIEGTGQITIRDLVKNALRMRPDRIVVGECRGEEAIDMLQAMNTGHDGSLTTLHAGTPEEAILRLILMARFGMDLPADLIEEQVATALNLIVMSVRKSNGKRYISDLCELKRSSDGKATLTSCISFDPIKVKWRLVKEPDFLQDMILAEQLPQEVYAKWKTSLARS